ncbi:MFS transporter [Francisella halioticida]|uniref:MFS transporter n=1 Tax=Francisella halioticida TaxID=549298 RepID=UPI0023EA7676|nr:MFS transporter [Francisella halioticida]
MAFAVSWGPVTWIIYSEIFPFKSKEIGMTITTMVNWTFVGIVSLTSLSVMKEFGNFASPLMFAAFCLLSIIFLKLFVPETKGISLEKNRE